MPNIPKELFPPYPDAPLPGERYRHRNGLIYLVLGVSRVEEDANRFRVEYRDLLGERWTRPWEEFRARFELVRRIEWVPDIDALFDAALDRHPELRASDLAFCPTCRNRKWVGHAIDCSRRPGLPECPVHPGANRITAGAYLRCGVCQAILGGPEDGFAHRKCGKCGFQIVATDKTQTPAVPICRQCGPTTAV